MASKTIKILFFIELFPLLPSQVGRHFVVVVIGQSEIARKVDFDSMALADRDRRKNVEELVQNLRGRLGHASRKSLTHAVGAGCRDGVAGSGFRDGSQNTDGERDAEDAQVVVVDLIAQPRVADLVEAFELVEADGKAVGHEKAVKRYRQTLLAEAVHPLCFTEQLRSRGNQEMLAVVGGDVG